MPAPPKPPRPDRLPSFDVQFDDAEIDTGEAGVHARLAGSLLNVFESLPTVADQQLLVELASVFGAAGKLRSVVVAVARAVVEHQ
jgi:hypothetical protein